MHHQPNLTPIATRNTQSISNLTPPTSRRPTAIMAPNNVSPLFRLLTPLLQTVRRTAAPSTTTTTSLRTLSTTPANLASGGSMNPKNRGKVVKADPRVQLIRYHLQHSKTPRPLRLSRMRSLRHWTIHRAWMLFRRQKKSEEELELQRYDISCPPLDWQIEEGC